MPKRATILASPFAIIAVGFLTAFIASKYIGTWAFVPLALVYWGLSFAVAARLGKGKVVAMFAKPSGGIGWPILAIAAGLVPLPILLMNLRLLNAPWIIALWIAFALANPFFEEIYWRGFLLESLPIEKKWIRSLYSSILFIAGHPLMWGVFSLANRNWTLFASLAVMSAVWSIVFFKTKSLWWCVASHILVDIFNLSVFVFLNLYTAAPQA